MNINIEAENNELILENSFGDKVIIPKEKRTWVQSKLQEKCYDCIDNYVNTLPVMEEYAEDGTTVSNLYTEKTGKPWSEAKKLGLTDGSYESNMRLKDELLAGVIGNSNVTLKDNINKPIPDKPIVQIDNTSKPDTNLIKRFTKNVDNKKEEVSKKTDIKFDPFVEDKSKNSKSEISKYSLPTLVDSELNKTFTCSTTNCSEYTTTAYANLLGKERAEIEKGVATDAWYKRSKVLNSGGTDLYKRQRDGSEGNWWEGLDLKEGDFVGLADGSPRKTMNFPDIDEEGNQKEKYERHSGIIVGKTADGVPIVEHNYLGTVLREPINNIKAKKTYYANSIYRSNHTAENQDYLLKKSLNRQNLEKDIQEGIEFEIPKFKEIEGNEKLGIDKSKVDFENVNKQIIEPYKNIRKDLALVYNSSLKEMDDIFKILIGIGAQESNLDNSLVDKPLKSKLNQSLTDNLPDSALKVAKAFKNAEVIPQFFSSNYELNSAVPNWKREIAYAKYLDQGMTKEEALHKVRTEYGVMPKTRAVDDKSKGFFKQKYPSQKWVKTIGEDLSFLEAVQKKNWGKEWDDNNENLIANAVGLFLENKEKAKELYPNESEGFYNKIATLAHSNSAAFDKEYIDFFIRGIGNPNPDEFYSDYLEKVKHYTKQLNN